jgi:hypothetical protein
LSQTNSGLFKKFSNNSKRSGGDHQVTCHADFQFQLTKRAKLKALTFSKNLGERNLLDFQFDIILAKSGYSRIAIVYDFAHICRWHKKSKANALRLKDQFSILWLTAQMASPVFLQEIFKFLSIHFQASFNPLSLKKN